MTSKIRTPRWAVGLALAGACVLVATAQVQTAAAPPAAPAADVVVDDIPFAPANGTAVSVPSACLLYTSPSPRD